MEILKLETEDVSFRKSMKRFPLSYQDPAGKSLVSLIIMNSKSPLKHTRIIQQMGYSVSTPDKNGWTPLHHTGKYSFTVYSINKSSLINNGLRLNCLTVASLKRKPIIRFLV